MLVFCYFRGCRLCCVLWDFLREDGNLDFNVKVFGLFCIIVDCESVICIALCSMFICELY